MHPDGDRRRGFFLTFEGPDGSGKSIQAARLAARLVAAGYPCLATREPGGTPVGEAVRGILLHSRDLAPTPTADALLFSAARAQQVAEVIGPALARGDVVVCDRFSDSTLAYQGYGAGEPLDVLRELQRYATAGLVPDLTILIDLPVETGIARKTGEEITRFEARRDLAWHRRVRDGFLAMAAAEPRRFVVVDGSGSIEAVEAEVAAVALPRLAARAARIGLVAGRNLASGDPDEPERPPVRMDR
jgi:dTMP kinase